MKLPEYGRCWRRWEPFERTACEALGEFRSMFNMHFLFASLIWGSVGVGYFIYGKRQRSWVPMVGGVLMVGASYFAGSALVMSLICIGLMAVTYLLLKRGF